MTISWVTGDAKEYDSLNSNMSQNASKWHMDFAKTEAQAPKVPKEEDPDRRNQDVQAGVPVERQRKRKRGSHSTEAFLADDMDPKDFVVPDIGEEDTDSQVQCRV